MTNQLIDIYTVKSPFEYGGRQYGIGDTWEPAGNRWDKLIMAQKVVKSTIPAGVGKGQLDALLEQSSNALRKRLKAAGLPIYGTKQQLAERLLEAGNVNE